MVVYHDWNQQTIVLFAGAGFTATKKGPFLVTELQLKILSQNYAKKATIALQVRSQKLKKIARLGLFVLKVRPFSNKTNKLSLFWLKVLRIIDHVREEHRNRARAVRRQKMNVQNALRDITADLTQPETSKI